MGRSKKRCCDFCGKDIWGRTYTKSAKYCKPCKEEVYRDYHRQYYLVRQYVAYAIICSTIEKENLGGTEEDENWISLPI